MKRVFICVAIALPLCLMLAASAFAGPLEDQLATAAYNCESGRVKALIDQGADVNAVVKGPEKVRTILEWADASANAWLHVGDQQMHEKCLDIERMLKAAGAKE